MFQEQQNNYNKYRNTSTALNNCILNAVDDKYIKTLKYKDIIYAKVTPNHWLKHLWKTYGEVPIIDLKENETQMKV